MSAAQSHHFRGGIAAQLGGEHAKVASIITNPDTDPHSHEPAAAGGRRRPHGRRRRLRHHRRDRLRRLVRQLLAADPAPGRSLGLKMLTPGDLPGRGE